MMLDPRDAVRTVRAAGPDDPVFDALLVAGPVLVAVVADAGRQPWTEALVVLYLASFVVYLGVRAAREGS